MIVPPGADSGTQCQLNEAKRKLVLLQIAYVHALRNQLRGLPVWPELSGLICEQELEPLRIQNNVALAIQHNMASILSECYRQGWLDNIRWASLDRTLSALVDGQGASERIKNTPMPRMYETFIRIFIDLFCLLLPFGMVASLRLWTPLGSTAVAFMFLALDKIGRSLEAPFENSPQDIPLTAISRTIEINLRQMLGDRDLPEPPAPVDGILW